MHWDALIERERQFWQAAGEPDFYRENFAEDGLCVFSMGILDKAATVSSMAGASEWLEVSFSDVRTILMADNVAALAYSATATTNQGDTYEVNVSSVYVNRDHDWQLILHQQSERSPLA